MILLYDKKYACPNCKSNFTTKKPLSSKLRVEKVESDNHKIYKGVNPYHYEINICPHCGYAFGENANKRLTIQKTEKIIQYLLNIKDFTRLTGERTHEDGLRTLKLGLYIAQLIEEPYYVKAGLSLKIAWIYREQGNSEGEMNYLKLSYDNYKKCYINEDFEAIGYKRYFMLYTLAELSRRLNDYEDAKRWYAELFAERNVPRITMNAARDLWIEFKEERKSSAHFETQKGA